MYWKHPRKVVCFPNKLHHIHWIWTPTSLNLEWLYKWGINYNPLCLVFVMNYSVSKCLCYLNISWCLYSYVLYFYTTFPFLWSNYLLASGILRMCNLMLLLCKDVQAYSHIGFIVIHHLLLYNGCYILSFVHVVQNMKVLIWHRFWCFYFFWWLILRHPFA